MVNAFFTLFALVAYVSFAHAAGKRGLAWPSDNHFNPSIFKTSSGQVTWLYTWGTTPPTNLNGAFVFYPMQWNGGGIASLATTVANPRPDAVLGFNEPDNASQANMTPATAASLWIQYIQPLKAKGIKLVSPAITNGGAPSGVAWMDSFMAACTGCTFDAIAAHWYGGWTTDLQSYVDSLKKYNKPIWLTEFALSWSATLASYEQFLPLALSYLDGEPAVEKYAFFGAFYSNGAWDMINSNGTLSALGTIYVS